MIPGSYAEKDPFIRNISDQDIDTVWAAVKITFVYAGADGKNLAKKGMPLDKSDMLTLYDIIEVDYTCDNNTSYWKRIDEKPNDGKNVSASDTSQVFYYKHELQRNEATGKLFTGLKIKKTASSEDIAFLKRIGGFAIHVEGFVVQKENGPENFNDFEEWGINGGVFFTNTPTKRKPLVFDDTGNIP